MPDKRENEKIVLTQNKKINIFNFEKIGRWWDYYRENEEISKQSFESLSNKFDKRKSMEIDIVALNKKTKEILFVECKWKDKVNAKELLAELKEKSRYVEWSNENRKEYFAVFAKSFSKKINEFEGKKVYLFDLEDIEKILKCQKHSTSF